MRAFSLHDPAFLRRVAGGGGSGGGSSLTLADLTAYWRLNEASDSDTAIDATGNGHTLALAGGLDVYAVAGKIGGARRALTSQSPTITPPAPASDPRYHIGSDHAAFTLGSSDYSAFGWLKDDQPEGGAQFRGGLHIGLEGTDVGFLITSEETGSSKFVRLITSSIVFADTPFRIAVDVTAWTFWAAGRVNSTGKFWLSVNGSARIFRTAAPFYLSAPYRTPMIGETFGNDAGGIENDAVGFKAGLLSDAQISWLWNGGAGRDITT